MSANSPGHRRESAKMKTAGMSSTGPWPWPAGYEILRLLSEGEGGVVALARKSSGGLVALKLMRLVEGANPDEALTRHERLRVLTAAPGLLRLAACGLTADRSWLWEELELADNLDGGPASVGDDYQPATLRAELIEHGPLSTETALSVGLALCASLGTLHAQGLVHRDVKPGNLLRVGGKVVLGDYGLTAPPGTPFDFKGTEGFVPSEGTADAAADLFALGKALYELWTGCDRLEFPTIPKKVLDHPDWMKHGAAFNEVLLRVCSPRSQERYQTAEKLASDLRAVVAGRSRWMTRRRWFAATAAATILAGAGGVSFLVLRRPPVMTWRQPKNWNYIPVEWGDQRPILDERRNCLFHLQCRRVGASEEAVLGRLDLASFEYRKQPLELVTANDFTPILHPEERTLWFAEKGLGPIWRLDPDSGRFTKMPGGTVSESDDDRSFGSRSYWNPVTKRFGCFGGYGWFAVRNWRWEFDAATGEWLNVERNHPGSEPRCRGGGPLMPIGDGRNLLLFGGQGSLSGKQDSRDPGLANFDGRFHNLGDLWKLDLATSKWTCVVPVPGLAHPGDLCSSCFLSRSQAVVVMHAKNTIAPFGTPAAVFIHRLGKDRGFLPVSCRGDVPDGNRHGYVTALPGGRSALAFQKAGIFELTLEI